MTRQISRMMTLVACAGLIAGATGCSSVAITGYPPQHSKIPPNSGPGTDKICRAAHDGFAVFDNGGAKYKPDHGKTMCVLQAQVGGHNLLKAQYNVLWNVNLHDQGCAAPVADSETQRSFASSTNKLYGFTLYFTPGNCPPRGTDVVLVIKFQ